MLIIIFIVILILATVGFFYLKSVKSKTKLEEAKKLFSKENPGECRMQNGEYPLGLEPHLDHTSDNYSDTCINLCAKYNWCLGLQRDIDKVWTLITDQTLFEEGTKQKLNGEWGQEIKIDGQKYTAYCNKKGCDNIGYITFKPREGYLCRVKNELQKKNKKIAEEKAKQAPTQAQAQAQAPSPSPK